MMNKDKQFKNVSKGTVEMAEFSSVTIWVSAVEPWITDMTDSDRKKHKTVLMLKDYLMPYKVKKEENMHGQTEYWLAPIPVSRHKHFDGAKPGTFSKGEKNYKLEATSDGRFFNLPKELVGSFSYANAMELKNETRENLRREAEISIRKSELQKKTFTLRDAKEALAKAYGISVEEVKIMI